MKYMLIPEFNAIDLWVGKDAMNPSATLNSKKIEVPDNITVQKSNLYSSLDISFQYAGKSYCLKVSEEMIHSVGIDYIRMYVENVYDDIHPKAVDYTVSQIKSIMGSPVEEYKDYSISSYSVDKQENEVAKASRSLPGMLTLVETPDADCARICAQGWGRNELSLWRMIQHLNDGHQWTRERIADWIDELHDSGVINAEFSQWNEGDSNEQDNGEG